MYETGTSFDTETPTEESLLLKVLGGCLRSIESSTTAGKSRLWRFKAVTSGVTAVKNGRRKTPRILRFLESNLVCQLLPVPYTSFKNSRSWRECLQDYKTSTKSLNNNKNYFTASTPNFNDASSLVPYYSLWRPSGCLVFTLCQCLFAAVWYWISWGVAL